MNVWKIINKNIEIINFKEFAETNSNEQSNRPQDTSDDFALYVRKDNSLDFVQHVRQNTSDDFALGVRRVTFDDFH
ncbi:hypothetical protein PoB_004220600 [Plakobranchus ocellatus]|uniref:Uncharacterized protein n=1 Tax=Plakobranchus ocellatus TaxID=259542 RepID=A0AAV4AX66_9GAST|nr:hypothetical protein PoB_004220600 [Plakobranchus ocellatus]